MERAHATLLATLSEGLQAAGIAQARLAHLGKKKAKLNDSIASMHLKRVTGKQSITAEQMFLISASAPNNPTDTRTFLSFGSSILNWHVQFKTWHLVRNRSLLDAEVEETLDDNNVDVMIYATIASVLLNIIEQQQRNEGDNNEPDANVSCTWQRRRWNGG